MQTFGEDFTQALKAEVTTLCWCWRLKRRDGVVLGFTDHDEDLIFEGLVYQANAAMQPSQIEKKLGTGIEQATAMGALNSSFLSEEDFEKGVYEGTEITLFRVNWKVRNSGVAIWSGEMSAIKRTQNHFEAEIKSFKQYLDQICGRRFSKQCDAVLGDTRCGIDKEAPLYHAQGQVVETVTQSLFKVSGLENRDSGWFSLGYFYWKTGKNQSEKAWVREQTLSGQGQIVELMSPMKKMIVPGDVFKIYVGCNKTPSVCSKKFKNIHNFQGFPFLITNDGLMSGPEATKADGKSRYRNV